MSNPNSPDKDKALASPSDLEGYIMGSYRLVFNGSQAQFFQNITLSTMADVHTSSYGNWGMQECSSEPRVAFPNGPGFGYSGDFYSPWQGTYRGIAQAHDGIEIIKAGTKIVDVNNVNQTTRTLAWAYFARGIAYGWLAMNYDQGYILEGTITQATKLPLKPYTELLKAALADLDECIKICATTFTIPNSSTVCNGLTITNTDLKKICYSYKARYRACVARTVAERAAVDWATVIADAQNGITTDFAPVGDNILFWEYGKYYGSDPSWTRTDYKLIGITDTSGGYQAWLNTPLTSRSEFLIKSADKRIHLPGDNTKDGTDFGVATASPFPPDRGTYHHSRYYHKRYSYFRPQYLGPMPVFIIPEIDLLIAEGKLRANDKAGAVTLINKTRVTRGGLKALTGTEATDEIMKWLKYEKLIETMTTAAGLVFWDRRGWGDLVTNTPVQLPIPGRELDIIVMTNYTFGGGGAFSAPKINFGPIKVIPF
ncbi:MAG: RagB/SusD family nutrient uptake outer membrane protein [bacterium]